jgi:hypothetical protein
VNDEAGGEGVNGTIEEACLMLGHEDEGWWLIWSEPRSSRQLRRLSIE